MPIRLPSLFRFVPRLFIRRKMALGIQRRKQPNRRWSAERIEARQLLTSSLVAGVSGETGEESDDDWRDTEGEAPVIVSPIGDIAAVAGRPIRVDLSGIIDPEGEPLEFSIQGADGRELRDYLFSVDRDLMEGLLIAPSNSQGMVPLALVAVDPDGNEVVDDFALNLTPNTRPQLGQLNGLLVALGDSRELDVGMHALDSDPDEELVFSAQLSDGRPLPDWIEIDESTGLLTAAPESFFDINQKFDVNVTVTDLAGESSTQSMWIVVRNQRPELNPDVELPEEIQVVAGEALDVTLPAYWAIDPDGQSLVTSFTVSEAPWMKATGVDPEVNPLFTPAAGARLQGQPRLSDVGTGTVTLTVTDDSHAKFSHSISIVVVSPATHLKEIKNQIRAINSVLVDSINPQIRRNEQALDRIDTDGLKVTRQAAQTASSIERVVPRYNVVQKQYNDLLATETRQRSSVANATDKLENT